MGSGNGRARGGAPIVGMIDGPQPVPAELLALIARAKEEHGPQIADQDARFEVRVEALGPLGVVRFTLVNKHINEVTPVCVYVPLSSILHVAGSYLVHSSGGAVGGHGA